MVKVLVVEDEGLYRQMLVSQLSTHPEIEVVGEADSGQEAIEQADRLSPEVVLMDIELGGKPNGIQASKSIRPAAPSTGIVLLSAHDDKQFLASTIEEQPRGWSYLLKQNLRDPDTLVRAIKGASWGLVVVDPQLTNGLQPREDTPLGRLTKEEITILELVAQGYTDAAIAEKLHIIDELVVQGSLRGIYQALDIAPDDEIDPRVKAVVAYLHQTRKR